MGCSKTLRVFFFGLSTFKLHCDLISSIVAMAGDSVEFLTCSGFVKNKSKTKWNIVCPIKRCKNNGVFYLRGEIRLIGFNEIKDEE